MSVVTAKPYAIPIGHDRPPIVTAHSTTSTWSMSRATVHDMRKILASSLVVVALGGLAGGISQAAGADPAAPPDTTPGMDIFADMGLTPEQAQCLIDSVGSVDTNDMTALTNLMTECGISLDQLLQIGQESVVTVPPIPTTEALAEAPPEIDAASAAAALASLGLDEATVDCLVSEAATATADDQDAETAFLNCGVGAAQILDGIVAIAAAAGMDTTLTTEVLDATASTVESTGNAMVDLLLEELASEGINLDADQGQCLLDNISDLDPNDITAIAAVFETCGIELSDIIPGG
jgi:hypothetical protein